MSALHSSRSPLLVGVLSWVVLSACDEAEAEGEDPTQAEASSGEGVGTEASAEPLSLVLSDAWLPATAEQDPLRDERPASVDCPLASWGAELGGLEIQTGTCAYFYATQPALVAIEPGDAVEVVMFHDNLDAAEPAEGHVALLLGDTVVWERVVEIPADANVLEGRWIADRNLPADTPVGLHLHNHGYNAWTLLEVTVTPGT